MKKRKDKMLANMKFIGNLFLRQLLAVKVIGQVVYDLIGIKETPPEEHMIECVCELLKAIGHTLDDTGKGKELMTAFAHRLLDLKKMQDSKTGKGVFSRRIQFAIQNLLDLRNNNWQMKVMKEQAKTKEEIRSIAVKEERAKAKGSDVMFATQTAGVRPAYIDDVKFMKPKPKTPEPVEKPKLDQAYVRKLLSYYTEENNGEYLEQNWNKSTPSEKEKKQGIEWLLDIGFNDKQKQGVVADVITELVLRKTVTWDILKDGLFRYLDVLEDMRMDVPYADVFFHSLLCKLLVKAGSNFNPVILKPLPTGDGCEFAWSLLVGALKKVKDERGPDAVRKALNISDLSSAACRAKRCQPSELNKNLQEEGIL